MFVISTRNFPPEIGGMQNLMGGLSLSLLKHGPVKVFAEKTNVENNFDNLEKLLLQLKAKYKVSVEKGVNIFTLRHHTAETIDEIEKNKTVLIKQITPKTVQIVTKPPNT